MGMPRAGCLGLVGDLGPVLVPNDTWAWRQGHREAGGKGYGRIYNIYSRQVFVVPADRPRLADIPFPFLSPQPTKNRMPLLLSSSFHFTDRIKRLSVCLCTVHTPVLAHHTDRSIKLIKRTTRAAGQYYIYTCRELTRSPSIADLE
jgi:hypothetical protein